MTKDQKNRSYSEGLKTLQDASKWLGISESTFRRMIERRDIEVVTVGRRKMIPVEALESYVRRNLCPARKVDRRARP
jgi:excisionase family DNA binding protein